MADITLTSSIRANLLSLQSTNKLLDRTSERLSTGLRVNSALDDPGAFFTARSLSNRASDLSKLKDGIGQAIQTIKATDTALTSITALVEQAKSIAEQAKEAAASAGNSVASVASVAATAGITSTSTLSAAFGTSNGDAFTLQVAGGAAAVTFSVTTGKTVQNLIDAISAVDSSITASWDATAKTIVIEGDPGASLTLTNTGSTPLTDVFGTNITSGTAVLFGSSSGGADVASLQGDYNKVLDQINLLVADAGYKGVNLLNDVDLDVTFDEQGDSVLTVAGVDLVTQLGLTTADWTTNAIEDSITETKDGLTELRTVASAFGTDLGIIQTREDFTTNFINGLEEGAGRLINANLEEESANLLALQTRQALGTTSLSFANQSQQSILQLFR